MRIKCVCRYNGKNYHGWQKQVGDITIEGVIEEKLSQVLNEDIHIYASGRTDAGVHALGQVFHFIVHKDELDLDKLRYSINLMLPEDIEILSMEQVDDKFHARFDVKVKTYEYKILLSSKDPFHYESHYVCPYPIDIDLFKKALFMFEGSHDFRSLTSKEEDEREFVREIYKIEFKQVDNEISILFTGNGFMRYMIRYMVGVALAISMHKEDISYIRTILDNKERNIVSYKAPAEGLYLVSVEY